MRGNDVNAGMPAVARNEAFWEIVSPFGFFNRGANQLYLTKDLFFSGHVSTTFLLLLYVWPHRRMRRWMLLGHALVVGSVFLSHLHYTIDVVGAYAVTFSIFALREWPLGTLLKGPPRSMQE